ncbi:MAG: hypothetical protein PHU14_03760 [Methylovulum sp.]|nr:hypothetical protein [Methylovulum sp.]
MLSYRAHPNDNIAHAPSIKPLLAIALTSLLIKAGPVRADIATLSGEVVDQQNRTTTETHSYKGYDSIRQAIENLDKPGSDFYTVRTIYDGLSKSGFDPQSVINADILGAKVQLSGAANDPALHLQSSDLQVSQTFSGSTRDESLRLLSTWAKNNASDLIKRANSLTPANTVTGTPFSATSISQQQDFDINDKMSLSARFGNYAVQDKNINVITLPLGTTWHINEHYALVLSVPLTYVDANGTPTYSASLGIGVKLPASHWLGLKNSWSLTPIVRGGAVGSDQNVANASVIYAGGLLSDYDLSIGEGVLGFKNMYSYYVTQSVSQYLDLKVNDVKINVPNITNSVFKNGAYYSHYLGPKIFGRKLSGTVFFNDTRFTGSVLYTDNQQEVGFNFGLSAHEDSSKSTGNFLRRQLNSQDFRLGISYTSAKDIDGFSANFGYSF